MSTAATEQNATAKAPVQRTASGVRAARAGVPAEAWAGMGLLGVAFVALFFRWIWKQHEHSSEKMEDWGHAYVIPLISAALIWKSRDAILREQPRTFWPALAPMMLGVMCYFFFVVGVPNHMLQGVAMVLTLGAMTLLLVGTGIFRHLFLPIAYLLFSITLAEQIMIKVTFQLQLMASKGAWLVLSVIGSVFGFVVELSGNTLTVAGNKMNVAEACSGMRMVVAFFALAGAVALLSCRHWWQRIALMLLAGPVAILMNVVRVAALGLLGLINMNFAAGDAHMLIGTLLLFPSLGLFMAVVWALNRIVDEQDDPKAKAGGAA